MSGTVFLESSAVRHLIKVLQGTTPEAGRHKAVKAGIRRKWCVKLSTVWETLQEKGHDMMEHRESQAPALGSCWHQPGEEKEGFSATVHKPVWGQPQWY